MSLSQKNVGLIQKSVEAVDAAHRAISDSVREQAETMVAGLTASTFGANTERVVAQYKTLSNITQGLSAVKSQLNSIKAMAVEFGNSTSGVILVKTIGRRKSLKTAAAVDVIAKTVNSTKSAKAGKGRGRKPAPAGTLTTNDSKLLTFLQSALKSGAPTAITGEALATGSGLPKGSLGVSMKKLMSMGAVKSAGRGMFQIGTSLAPSDTAPLFPAAVPLAIPGRMPKSLANKPAKVVTVVKTSAVKVAKPDKQAKEVKATVETKATLGKKSKKAAPAAKKVSTAKAVSVAGSKPKTAVKRGAASKAKTTVATAKLVRVKATKVSIKPKAAVKNATPVPVDATAAMGGETALV